MRLAVAQIRVRAGLPAKNFEAVARAWREAAAAGADLVVFPELCISGYFVGDHWEREGFLAESEHYGAALRELTAHGPAALFGNVAVDRSRRNEDGSPRKYNAAFLAHRGAFIEHPATKMPFWVKTLLPNYREFDDSRYFFDLRKLARERGEGVETLLRPATLELDGRATSIAIAVCEDGWDAHYGFSPLGVACSTADVDFCVNISASPFHAGSKQAERDEVFRALSGRLGKPIAYANLLGVQNTGQTIFTFDGGSRIFQPGSAAEAEFGTPQFEESLLIARFDASTQRFSAPAKEGEKTPPRPPAFSLNGTALRARALEFALTAILEEWGLKRVVIGASGGIDSSLSALLFARVLGPQAVTLVNLPSRHNSQLLRTAAATLAQRLGCAFSAVPIQEAVDHTLAQLIAFDPALPEPTELVRENVQARDRGARVVAGLAAHLSAVFPCNANKSELTAGYGTLYGDLAGFLAPLGDLWKHQVYAVAEHLNGGRGEDHGPIPTDTFRTVPSAELSAAQDVTQGKGDPIDYPYFDALFRWIVEGRERPGPCEVLGAYAEGALGSRIGLAETEIAKRFGTPRDFVRDFERWWGLYVGMGAFKRVQAPPVLALSPRAFGTNHRECVGPLSMGLGYDALRAKLLY